MIAIIIVLLLHQELTAQIADSSNCRQFHRGKFSYTDSSGNTVMVDRKRHYQYDKNPATGVRWQYKIKWINDCQYELTLVSTNSKAVRKNKYSTTGVIISKIPNANSYEYTCACKDADMPKNTGVMKKIN
ncbi:hypothetical protein [Ferruginibacter sp.]